MTRAGLARSAGGSAYGSIDYSHITCDSPNSWKTINPAFVNVDAAEKHSIRAGNTIELFRFQ